MCKSIRSKQSAWHNFHRIVKDSYGSIATYIAVFVTSTLGAAWVYRLRPKDLTYPWRVVDSDLSAVYSLAQALGQSWTGMVNYSLGAPFTADLSLAFIPDDLQVEILRILMHLTNNPFVAVNLFYLLTFGLCAITFLFLTDTFKLSRWISTPLALSYAWMPYHFTRMDAGHVFLAAYYMLPIGVVYLHRLFEYLTGSLVTFFPASTFKRIGFVLGIIAVGSSGTYYGVFFALLAATMILLVPQQNQPLRITAQRGGLTALVSFLFITAPLLRIVSSRLRGLETVLTRSPEESIQFGGSIARLLVPWGVWLPTKLKPVVLPTEFEWTISPILGVIGVWILIIGIAVSISGRSSVNHNHKSIRFIFIWALLFYTATGVSLVFAYAIDPSFRCWNRLSIVIMTLALVALGASLNRFSKFNKTWFPVLLIVAVFSQLSPLHDSGIGTEPDVVSKDAFNALQQVAAVIQQEIKPGCQILQLPIMAYPEGGQVGQVGNGAHLWLPTLTSGFRWSYGAPKGTQEGDYWPKLSGESIQMQVRTAARESFCAVIIDLRSDIKIDVTDMSPYRLVQKLSYYAIYSR
jgi:phosphoglycerol transferase